MNQALWQIRERWKCKYKYKNEHTAAQQMMH